MFKVSWKISVLLIVFSNSSFIILLWWFCSLKMRYLRKWKNVKSFLVFSLFHFTWEIQIPKVGVSWSLKLWTVALCGTVSVLGEDQLLDYVMCRASHENLLSRSVQRLPTVFKLHWTRATPSHPRAEHYPS